MRIWHRGRSSQPAFASDYAHLVNAYTRIYEATGKSGYLRNAQTYARHLIDLFEDKEHGGFFTVGTDQEQLITRTKDLFDGATPSTNSIAAQSLARLSKLTDSPEFRVSAMGVIQLLAEGVANHPGAFSVLVQTMSLLDSGSQEIVIPGNQYQLIDQLKGRWMPDAVIAHGDSFNSPLWTGRLEGFAYICRNFTCLQPISQPSDLADALNSLV